MIQFLCRRDTIVVFVLLTFHKDDGTDRKEDRTDMDPDPYD